MMRAFVDVPEIPLDDSPFGVHADRGRDGTLGADRNSWFLGGQGEPPPRASNGEHAGHPPGPPMRGGADSVFVPM